MPRPLHRPLAAALGLFLLGCAPASELRESFDESYDTLMGGGGEPRAMPAGVPVSEAVAGSAGPSPAPERAAGGGFTLVQQGQSIERSYAQIGDRTIPGGARFIDAEVNEFLRIVFEEILVAPFVTVGRLEGTVNLELAAGLPFSTWINSIDAQIQPLGGALRFERGVFAAVRQGETLFESSANVGFLPLTYADPGDVARILTEVFPGVRVIPAEAAGALVVLEFQRLALFLELAEFARTLDRGSLQDKTLFIHRLAQAGAEEVVRELELITGPQDGQAGGYRSARFLPIRRLNAVLGVVTPGTDIGALRVLLESLDRVDTPRLAQGVRMVALRNSRAADVVTQIRVLIGDGQAMEVIETAVSTPRTDRDARPGFFQRRAEAEAGSGRAGPSGEAGAARRDGGFEGLPPPPPLPPGAAFAPAGPAAAAAALAPPVVRAAGQPFRITADPSRNVILMSGEPGLLNAVEALVRDIDREEVRQVYIETALVDITLKEQLRYGLSSIFSAGNAQIIPFSTAASVAPAFPGLNILFDNNTIAGVLSLLSSVSDVRVISAPRLAMINNSQAVLNVGDEVPVLVSQVTDRSNPDAVVNAVEFRETGVILRLAPTIMSDEAILLDITQELTEARGTTAEAVQLTPLFSRRALQTSLRIYSGDVIMLGGLRESGASVTKDRLPIPIIGDLLGATGDATNLREMVLLVRPLIVRDQQQLTRVTKEVREGLNALWGIDRLRESVFGSGGLGPHLERQLDGVFGSGPPEPAPPQDTPPPQAPPLRRGRRASARPLHRSCRPAAGVRPAPARRGCGGGRATASGRA